MHKRSAAMRIVFEGCYATADAGQFWKSSEQTMTTPYEPRQNAMFTHSNIQSLLAEDPRMESFRLSDRSITAVAMLTMVRIKALEKAEEARNATLQPYLHQLAAMEHLKSLPPRTVLS